MQIKSERLWTTLEMKLSKKNTIKIENPSCAVLTFVVCNLVSELENDLFYYINFRFLRGWVGLPRFGL